ncbi:hypothetical protein [Nostoc sp.]|uniref:hypothetical protein n=1 Tax=Nostoc sp. TaxID=1180 RepID=UPI002FF9D14B
MSVPCISGRAGCPPHKNHPLIQQRSIFISPARELLEFAGGILAGIKSAVLAAIAKFNLGTVPLTVDNHFS